jgi:hypothetical protein
MVLGFVLSHVSEARHGTPGMRPDLTSQVEVELVHALGVVCKKNLQGLLISGSRLLTAYESSGLQEQSEDDQTYDGVVLIYRRVSNRV